MAELGENADYASTLATAVAAQPPSQREDYLIGRESADGEVFERMLAAVYRVYYTSPAVLAVVAELADAGPREALVHFDPSLLDQVGRNRPGRRRL